MRPFLADLHIHSVLSACADDLMFPVEVVEAAVSRGLAIIALTDHNSSENCYAFAKAAKRVGLQLLPGMEVTSREEVHVLAIFGEVADALGWQQHVYKHLPPLPNDEAAFGTQLVVNSTGEIVSINERLLQTATDLPFADVMHGIAAAGGIAIPAHVDRPAFSLIGQLGFVPEDLSIPIVEFSRNADPDQPGSVSPTLLGRQILQSSDAHFLADIGSATTTFWLEEPSFAELTMACCGLGGRRISHENHGVPSSKTCL